MAGRFFTAEPPGKPEVKQTSIDKNLHATVDYLYSFSWGIFFSRYMHDKGRFTILQGQ